MKLYQESNISDISDIEAQTFNQYFVSNIDLEYFQIHSSFLFAKWHDIYDKVNSYLQNHNIDIPTEINPYDLEKQHENAVIEVIKICLAILLVFNKRYLMEQLKKLHIDYQKEIVKEIDIQVDELREQISKNYLFYIRENKDKNELIKKLQEVMDKNTSMENALLKINEQEANVQRDRTKLKEALEMKKTEIKEFNFEIKKLSDQLEKSNEDLAHAEEEIRQLLEQNKNLIKQKNSFYDQMVVAEQKYQDLLQTEQNFKKLVQRNNMLQKELDEAQNQIERDRTKVEGYDQMVKNDNEMKQLLNSNNMTLKDYKEKQKSHIDQIMKYEKDIKDKNEYVNYLETQNAVLERNYNDLQKDFKIYKSHAKAQVNDETFSMDNFDINKPFDVTNPMGESYISEKLMQSTVIQEEIKRYKEQMEDLRQDYDNLKKRSKKDVDELLVQIEELQMKNYNLEEKINSMQKNGNIQSNTNLDEKENLKNIKKLQKDISDLQKQKDQEISDLKQQITTKDLRIKDQDQNIRNLQQMINLPQSKHSLQSLDNKPAIQDIKIIEDTDKIDNLRKENQLNENALNKNRKTLLDYQQQQLALQDHIQQLEEELKKERLKSKQRGDDMFYAQEQQKKLEQDMQRQQQGSENLSKNNKDLLEKISQLESKIRDLQRSGQQDQSQTDLQQQLENLTKSNTNNLNQINSLKNTLKVYSDKDQENELYIQDLQKKLNKLNERLQEAQKNVKTEKQTQYIIEEKFKPIGQDEFEYAQLQLMYSTFMGYYTDHLKYDSYLLKRVQDTRKALTKNFSIGRLLND